MTPYTSDLQIHMSSSQAQLLQWKEWKIPAGSEHRFEVPFDCGSTPFTFKLTEGSAEIFGSELAPGREYSVTGCKLAIFTFTGAKIVYQGGPCSVEYLSSELATAQEALLNLQVALEGHCGSVPRVLLLGVGRNTVARTLTNYAVRRMDESGNIRPILVDLDVSNGSVCLPGTLSAVAPDRPLDVEESWHSQPQNQMISLFYGSTAVADNSKVYSRLCERMGEIVKKRCGNETTSVVYVIAPGEVSNESVSSSVQSSLLTSLQSNFDIDHVLVIGNERLHVTVSKHFSTTPGIKVLKVPRAGGVVAKDTSFRRANQSKSFKSYFYGPRAEFHPFSLTVPFGNLTIYRVADATALAPSSALPLGATRKIDSSKLTKVTDLVPSQLLYSILAVVLTPPGSDPEMEEFEDALVAPVAGFLHVLEVDETRQTLTVLAPCPGALPSKFLLISSLKWVEK